MPSRVKPRMAVINTAGIRPNLQRSSQSHTGLSKKLNSTASVKGTSTPLAKYSAAITTAIDASVNIHDGWLILFGRNIGSSVLSRVKRHSLPRLEFPPQHEADA